MLIMKPFKNDGSYDVDKIQAAIKTTDPAAAEAFQHTTVYGKESTVSFVDAPSASHIQAAVRAWDRVRDKTPLSDNGEAWIAKDTPKSERDRHKRWKRTLALLEEKGVKFSHVSKADGKAWFSRKLVCSLDPSGSRFKVDFEALKLAHPGCKLTIDEYENEMEIVIARQCG